MDWKVFPADGKASGNQVREFEIQSILNGKLANSPCFNTDKLFQYLSADIQEVFKQHRLEPTSFRSKVQIQSIFFNGLLYG